MRARWVKAGCSVQAWRGAVLRHVLNFFSVTMGNGIQTMKSSVKKHGKNRREIERSVRIFWGAVLLVGLFAVLLMHAALAATQ